MKIDIPALLSSARLEAILARLPAARIGVLGDICLDLYWHADMTRSVLSRETPHFPLPVVREDATPGAAGNVASNIAALAQEGLHVLGVVGDDWRGSLLLDAFAARGIRTDGIIRTGERVTNAYIKPMRKGYSDVVYEDPRLDFENHTPMTAGLEQALIARLNTLAPSLDVLCVCDQMEAGCITDAVREAIMAWGQRGLKVIVDSRTNIGRYRHVIVKPNELEGAYAVLKRVNPLELEQLAEVAAQLVVRGGRPALVTAGNRGCLLAEEDGVRLVPACPAPGPYDICGAGDTFMSAFALAYGTGADLAEAVYVGNIAASVSICKIGVTGTADMDEIRRAHAMWLAGDAQPKGR